MGANKMAEKQQTKEAPDWLKRNCYVKYGDDKFRVLMDPDEPTRALKEQLEKQTGIACDEQRIFYNGMKKPFQDDKNLRFYGAQGGGFFDLARDDMLDEQMNIVRKPTCCLLPDMRKRLEAVKLQEEKKLEGVRERRKSQIARDEQDALAKAAEAARLVAEEEAARQKADLEAARLKKEEKDRLARKAAAKKAEEERLAREAEAARLAAEQETARKKAQAEAARLKKEEDERLARLAAAKKAEEDERLARLAAAKKAEEDERLARLAAAKKAEEKRLAAEARKREEEAAALLKKEEEDRLAVEAAAKKAEEERLALMAAAKKAEEERLAEEARKMAEEEAAAKAKAKEEKKQKKKKKKDGYGSDDSWEVKERQKNNYRHDFTPLDFDLTRFKIWFMVADQVPFEMICPIAMDIKGMKVEVLKLRNEANFVKKYFEGLEDPNELKVYPAGSYGEGDPLPDDIPVPRDSSEYAFFSVMR